MLILPALAVLLTYVYWRPHQVFEFLSPITVNFVVILSLFGLVLDLRLRATKLRGSPLLAPPRRAWWSGASSPSP